MLNQTRQVVLLACVAITASMLPAGAPDSGERAVDLFSRMAGEAARVQDLAARLEGAAAPVDALRAEPRAAELNVARAEVGRIGKNLDRLLVLRREIEPWQQEIVDHLNAAVVGLADNLDMAAASLKDGSDPAEYKDAIAAAYDWASYVREIAASAAAFGEEQGTLPPRAGAIS